MKISYNLEEIAVYERRADYFRMDNPIVKLIEDYVTTIDTQNCRVQLQSGVLNRVHKCKCVIIGNANSRRVC